MSDAPATPENDLAAWQQAAVQRQYAVLEQLAEAGLRLALVIEAEAAQAAAAGQPVRDDAAMAFSRVARAVRLTVMLQSRLLEAPQAPRAGSVSQAGAAQDIFGGDLWAPCAPLPVEVERRLEVRDIVRGVAEDAALDRETVERLVFEAGERCKSDDIYFLVRDWPLGALVARICEDLGLDPDWSRLAQEAWAKTEIESASPKSPFLPRERQFAAGGGPPAAEPVVEGAGGVSPAFHGSS